MPRFELPLLLQKVVIFGGREVEIFYVIHYSLFSCNQRYEIRS